MASPELDALILEHLSDIDAAAKRLLALEGRVFGAMDAAASEWAKEHGWAGKFDFFHANETWLAPPDWRKPDSSKEDDFKAWFQLQLGAGDTGELEGAEDYFYLTRLCQAGAGQIGFRFGQNLVKKGVWNRAFKAQTHAVSKTAFVADAVPSYFLQVRLGVAELAQALREDAPEDALSPFKEALERLGQAKPAFDAVLRGLGATP